MKRATEKITKILQLLEDFNPRPREEGDRFSLCRSLPNIYFNPRPREEGDPSRIYSRSLCRISIHALVKRATQQAQSLQSILKYFNPRPREEGDPKAVQFKSKTGDFNPRPREEGDRTHSTRKLTTINFNPRPREEGDYMYGTLDILSTFISIHALVKRATLSIGLRVTSKAHFNPRPREEGDVTR